MKTTTVCVHAEQHDVFRMKLEENRATLYVEGGATLILSDLSKDQVIRLRMETGRVLASWPGQCEFYRCEKLGAEGCWITCPTSGERLPACVEHHEESSAEPRVGEAA